MTQLIYRGRHVDGVVLVDGTVCPHGDAVDVADDIATALLAEQPEAFEVVKPARQKQPAAKSASSKEDS